MADEKLDIEEGAEEVEEVEEVEEAPEVKGTIAAFTGTARMNIKEAVAWLEAEAERASGKMRDPEGTHNVQGALMQYQACEDLLARFKAMKAANAPKAQKDKLAALLKKPMNLMVEIAEIKAAMA